VKVNCVGKGQKKNVGLGGGHNEALAGRAVYGKHKKAYSHLNSGRERG